MILFTCVVLRNEGELISQIISLNIRNKDQTFSELQVPIQITFEIKVSFYNWFRNSYFTGFFRKTTLKVFPVFI